MNGITIDIFNVRALWLLSAGQYNCHVGGAVLIKHWTCMEIMHTLSNAHRDFFSLNLLL